MTYDDPYRPATLLECSDAGGSIYYAISQNEDDDRVMSAAAYAVFERVVVAWFKQPDVLSCRLNIEEQTIDLFIDTPGDDIDHLAIYTLPLAELVLSAAHTSKDYSDHPPSDVSAMLRKLADEIDKEQGNA